MRLLAKYHDLESVWLVAHEGCAFYLEKHPHLDADARHARQVEDLARGRASLLERYPNLHVRLIYAARHGESAIFEHCSDPVEKGRR